MASRNPAQQLTGTRKGFYSVFRYDNPTAADMAARARGRGVSGSVVNQSSVDPIVVTPSAVVNEACSGEQCESDDDEWEEYTDEEEEEECSSENTDSGSSDEEKRKSALLWRMGVCSFAVLLLWCTTLSLAQTIVSSTSPVPPVMSLYRSCRFAYDEMMVQQEWYEDCAEGQLARCEAEYDMQLKHSINYATSVQQANKDKLKELQNFQSNCSNLLDTLYDSLKTLSSSSPIVFKSDCSSSDQADLHSAMDIDVAKSVSMSDSLATTVRYVQDSKRTVQNLTDYADRLHNYNNNYLANKTSLMRAELSLQVNSIYSRHWLDEINITLAGLKRNMSTLVSCISLSTATEPPLADCVGFPWTLASLYSNTRSLLEANRADIMEKFNEVEETFFEYGSEVQDAVSTANDFYSAVVRGTRWVNENLAHLSSDTVSLCDIEPSPNWCDFRMKMWSIDPLAEFHPVNVRSVPTGDDFWHYIEDPIASALARNDAAFADIVNSGNMWRDKLANLTEDKFLIFDDYNPPLFDSATSTSLSADEVSISYAAESDRYLEDMHVRMANLSSVTPDQVTSETINVNSTAFITDMINAAESQLSSHSFTFQSMTLITDFDIVNILEQIGDLNQILLLLDILFRVFQTIRLVRRYWDKSAVPLPIVDMTCGIDLEMDEYSSSGWKLLIYKSFTLFGHIWIVLAITLLTVVIVLFTLAGLYLPTFTEYQVSCVSNGKNESFLSSNLKAVAFNYASNDGHSVIFKGLSDYNSRSAEVCSRFSADARSSYNLLMQEVETLAVNHEPVARDSRKVDHCINLTVMDSMRTSHLSDLDFNESTAGFSNNSSYALASMIPPNCSYSLLIGDMKANAVNQFALPGDIFNCSQALPTCTITCEGPEPDIFRVLSKHCSCTAEWLVHSSLLNSLALIAVYVLINLSRYCFCRSIATYLWSNMTIDGDCDYNHHFMGSCNSLGIVADPVLPMLVHHNHNDRQMDDLCTSIDLENIYSGCEEKFNSRGNKGGNLNGPLKGCDNNSRVSSRSYAELLHQRLQRALWKLKLEGHVFLFLAVIVNVPWLIFVLMVNARIAYEP